MSRVSRVKVDRFNTLNGEGNLVLFARGKRYVTQPEYTRRYLDLVEEAIENGGDLKIARTFEIAGEHNNVVFLKYPGTLHGQAAGYPRMGKVFEIDLLFRTSRSRQNHPQSGIGYYPVVFAPGDNPTREYSKMFDALIDIRPGLPFEYMGTAKIIATGSVPGFGKIITQDTEPDFEQQLAWYRKHMATGNPLLRTSGRGRR